MSINYLYDIWNPSRNMFFGNAKTLTNFKTHKFLIGYQQNTEIFNLAKSRQLLILQIIPFLKTMFRDQGLSQTPQFLFASETTSMQKVLKTSSQYCDMPQAIFPWINGYLTARAKRKHKAEYCIIPDVTQSNSIVNEAHRNFMVIIGLVNSNQPNLESISHPIFSNCTNIKMCQFFSLLVASLIAKYATESFFSFSPLKVKTSVRYNYALMTENSENYHPLFWKEEFARSFAKKSWRGKIISKNKSNKQKRRIYKWKKK